MAGLRRIFATDGGELSLEYLVLCEVVMMLKPDDMVALSLSSNLLGKQVESIALLILAALRSRHFQGCKMSDEEPCLQTLVRISRPLAMIVGREQTQWRSTSNNTRQQFFRMYMEFQEDGTIKWAEEDVTDVPMLGKMVTCRGLLFMFERAVLYVNDILSSTYDIYQANLPEGPGEGAVLSTLSGDLFASGGWDFNNDGGTSTRMWRWNFEKEVWEVASQTLKISRYDHSCVEHNGAIVIGGGTHWMGEHDFRAIHLQDGMRDYHGSVPIDKLHWLEQFDGDTLTSLQSDRAGDANWRGTVGGLFSIKGRLYALYHVIYGHIDNGYYSKGQDSHAHSCILVRSEIHSSLYA